MRYILLICIPLYMYGMLDKQEIGKPTLYRMQPFHEKRYSIEKESDGLVYICQQELFPRNFISVPSVYCRKGEPIIVPNTQFIPYEVSCWYDGIDAIICQHNNGTLSGYFNVRSCQQKPPATADVLGETRNAYIIKDKSQGDAICDE